MIAVRRCLDVFVSPLTCRDDHGDRSTADTDIVIIRAAFYVHHCLLLRSFPARAIGINPADVDYSLVWIGSVALVNASDLYAHWFLNFSWTLFSESTSKRSFKVPSVVLPWILLNSG